MADSLPPFRYNNFLCSGPLVRDSARGYLTTDSRSYELLAIWRRGKPNSLLIIPIAVALPIHQRTVKRLIAD